MPPVGVDPSEIDGINDLLISTGPFYLFLLIEDRYHTKGARIFLLEKTV